MRAAATGAVCFTADAGTVSSPRVGSCVRITHSTVTADHPNAAFFASDDDLIPWTRRRRATFILRASPRDVYSYPTPHTLLWILIFIPFCHFALELDITAYLIITLIAKTTTDKHAGKTVSIRHISCILFASTTVDYVYIAHIHTARSNIPCQQHSRCVCRLDVRYPSHDVMYTDDCQTGLEQEGGSVLV